jgi:hypothetical protein
MWDDDATVGFGTDMYIFFEHVFGVLFVLKGVNNQLYDQLFFGGNLMSHDTHLPMMVTLHSISGKK